MSFREKYWNAPDAFVLDCFRWNDGKRPYPYQLDILRRVAQSGRLAFRGPRGLGKSAVLTWILIWYALTRDLDENGDWKIITTASGTRQLERFLWPEVHKWIPRLKWELIGREPIRDKRELMYMGLKLVRGEASAAASDQPSLMEGAHATHLLYIFDEAKTIPGPTFDAIEGAFSNAGADSDFEGLAITASSPGEPSGRFYDICRGDPRFRDWQNRAVTLKECVAAGSLSRDWVLARLNQWGKNHPFYLNQVRGEFATSEADGVIPMAWVEQAFERWYDWDARGRPKEGAAVLGADVGGGSEEGDATVLAPCFGHRVDDLRKYSSGDIMATVGRARQFQTEHGGLVRWDAIGIGAGAVARGRELKLRQESFIASGRSTGKDRSGEIHFTNLRAEAWWSLRDLLNPAFEPDVCLPPDEELLADLTTPHWHETSRGRVTIEDKDQIRRRLGRSTNCGDAVVIGLYAARRKQIHPGVVTFARPSPWGAHPGLTFGGHR